RLNGPVRVAASTKWSARRRRNICEQGKGCPRYGEMACGASALRERFGQQVVYTEDWRVGREVVPIQQGSLRPDDRQDIAPLAVRHSTATPKPAQLLKQNVFRRVHEQRAIADLHWPA